METYFTVCSTRVCIFFAPKHLHKVEILPTHPTNEHILLLFKNIFQIPSYKLFNMEVILEPGHHGFGKKNTGEKHCFSQNIR